MRWPSFPNLSKLKDKVPPKGGEVSVKPQFAKNGPIGPPPPDTFEYMQLADGTRVPVINDVQPNFEGVGDTMGFGEGYFGTPTCAYCGSPGAHKPDCKTLTRNWGSERGSLGTQRQMTERLRNETTQSFTGGVSDGARQRAAVAFPTRVPDTRTELQKRFDEIAAELAETKDGE